MKKWLCILAFCVSFGYALIYQITPSVDARKFHEIAVNLVTKGTFCFECNVPLAEDTAIRDIGPGYQFFLAGVYKIFGVHPWIVWLLQSLMHAIVVFWIWTLVSRFMSSQLPLPPLDSRGGANGMSGGVLIPLWMYAVHPDIIQNNAMLMADSLFTFLFVGSVMLFLPLVTAEKDVRWTHALLLGALLGAMTMVRPTGLPVFVVMLGVLLWRKMWRAALISLVFFIAVQTPWAIRNMRVYDHFVYNSVVGGLDIWVGLYPKGTGEFNMDALPEIRSRIATLNPEEIDAVSMEEAKKIIREQPLFAIQRTASKFFKLFALTKTSGFWFHYHGAADQLVTIIASILWNIVMLGLGIAGILLAILRREFKSPLLWVCVVAIAIMSVGPTIAVVVNRYRLPMLPFLAILGVYWLAHARGRERWMSLAGSAAFIALATGIDLSGSWSKVMERVHRLRS